MSPPASTCFYKEFDYTNQASYKAQRIGGTLRARYPLTDEWSAGVNYTFVRNTLYDVGPAASAAIKEAITGSPDAKSSTYNTSSVGYSLTYDTRDNKKRPTSGVYYSVAQDLAGLGGDVRFVRSIGEARAYYPVNDEITAMGRATGGIISGWGGQDVRLLDLFYKGGETMRGFAIAGYGPRDTLSANQDALGGRMFYAHDRRASVPDPRRAAGFRPARCGVCRRGLAMGRQQHSGQAAGRRRQHAGATRFGGPRARLGFTARHAQDRLCHPPRQAAVRQDAGTSASA